MHTIMVIMSGLALLGGLAQTAGALGKSVASAAGWFIPLWAAGAGLNMWIGVVSAGYSVAQELPVFFVVFGIPALAAWYVRRRHQT